jgi:membrane protease YdiL (CAAX protease family)
MSAVRRHPLITFFVLTYAISWILESPLVLLQDTITATQILVLQILASNVPSLLAIVLTAIVLGRGALRKLLGRLLIWRVDLRWYLVVVFGPTALVLCALTFNALLLGGPALSFFGMPLLGAVLFLAFMTFPGSAIGEEIGWRGYALPRLQAGRSALTASLILGALWSLWHLPLWLTGAPSNPLSLYPAFVIAIIASSVIYTWVYNSTGGSLLLLVVLHATFNWPLTMLLVPLGSQMTLPFLVYAALMVVAAIVVVIVAGPKHLSRKHQKQEEEEEEEEELLVATQPERLR